MAAQPETPATVGNIVDLDRARRVLRRRDLALKRELSRVGRHPLEPIMFPVFIAAAFVVWGFAVYGMVEAFYRG